jgi:hypothetical protein
MYNTGKWQCELCSATLEITLADYVDAGMGILTQEAQNRRKDWSRKRGITKNEMYYCPKHNRNPMVRYRLLEEQLVAVREKYRGIETEEENDLLDQMEYVWYLLNDEEHNQLNKEPPRSLILSRDDQF